jgi:hypothetical protein
MEPAVSHRPFGRFRVVVVALHDDVAADDDLAYGLPVGRDLAADGVHYPQLVRGQQLYALLRLDDSAVRGLRALVLGQQDPDTQTGAGPRCRWPALR